MRVRRVAKWDEARVGYTRRQPLIGPRSAAIGRDFVIRPGEPVWPVVSCRSTPADEAPDESRKLPKLRRAARNADPTGFADRRRRGRAKCGRVGDCSVFLTPEDRGKGEYALQSILLLLFRLVCLGIALFVMRICRMPLRIPRTSFRCYVAAKHRRDAHAGRPVDFAIDSRDSASQSPTTPNPMRTGPWAFTISLIANLASLARRSSTSVARSR